MNARVLFVLLVMCVALAFTARFRRVGIVLSVVVTLLLIWFSVNPSERSRNDVRHELSRTIGAPAQRQVESLPLDSIELLNPQLNGNGAPWQLSVNARNTTRDHVVTNVTVGIKRFDCPRADTPIAECMLNWQGEPTLHARLEPGATRVVNESFWSHDSVTRLTGVARVEFTVLAVQASAQSVTAASSE